MEMVKELCAAAAAGDLERVRSLLIRNPDLLDARDVSGSALHWAVLRCRTETISYLLERGADPNIRTPEGFTALDIARKEAHPELEKILRAYGAVLSKPRDPK